MEVTPMKLVGIISTAVLFLLLGTTAPAYAEQHEEHAQVAKPAQHAQQKQEGRQAKSSQHAQQKQESRQAKSSQHAQQKQEGRQAKSSQHAEQKQEARQAKSSQHAEQKQEGRQAKSSQHAEQKQESRQAKSSQHAQRQEHAQQSQRGGGNRGGGQYGRISNANYSAHFGRGHSFHMGRPRMIGGYNRFQYGGYWFGFNEAWPVGWGYNDDCYVEYIDGDYYMFNLRHPGFRLTLNIF
jgi:DNA mismatch repair ATPase MutL